MGKYDKALADCSEAIRLTPDDIAARYLRGLVRYHASDYASAIDDFSEVIRLDSKYASAYRSRGDAYARLGDGTRAGADRDLALRLAASRVDPVVARGSVPLPNPPTAMPRERPTLKASPVGRETLTPAGSIPLTRSRL
jgi:tetratricopeptide (TPR) repeat protein